MRFVLGLFFIGFLSRVQRSKAEEATFTTHPPEARRCPSGWKQYDRACYKIFSKGMERNFQEAKTTCEIMDSHLAIIKSQQHQDFLTSYLGQQEMKDTVWLGLSKHHNSGDDYALQWVDNTTAEYTNFQPDQPDGGRREACIHMLAREVTAGKWNDIRCIVKLGFVCQFSLVGSSTPKDGMDEDSRCPPGSKYYLGTCYKLEEGEDDWFKAEEQCRTRYGGHLISILDETEQAFIGLLTAKVDNEIWTGFSDTNKSTEGVLRWSDHRPVYHTNWAQREPSDDYFGQRCIAIQRKKKWEVRDCNEKHRFICALHLINEKAHTLDSEPISGSCPPDFIDVGNQYCYFISKNWLPFAVAKHECANMGVNGTLAEFRSEHDLSLLRRHLSRHTWFGLTVGVQETGYKFYSYVTDREDKASYLPWKPLQPDNADTEKCVELLVSIMKYNNYPCGWGKLFLCQSDKLIKPKISVRLEDQAGLSGGAVAGIILVVLIVVSTSSVVGFYFFRKRYLDNQVKDAIVKFHNEPQDNSSNI